VKSYFYAISPEPGAVGAKNSHIFELPSRIKLSAEPLGGLYLETAYEISARFQDKDAVSLNSGQALRAGVSAYRAYDLNRRLYPASGASAGDRFFLFQNLDRLMARYSAGPADFYIGRQPVSFGSARVVNPTDIIAPFNYGAIDKEYSSGVDAAIARVSFGGMSSVSGGVIAGNKANSNESAAFVKAEIPVPEGMVSLLGSIFSGNMLAGFDLQRSMKGAGFWLETAYVRTSISMPSAVREEYSRLSTGLDYSFGHGFYGLAEYHYNGAGSAHAGDYGSRAYKTAYREAGVFLLGRHYFIPSLSYEAYGLLRIYASSIFNVQDRSVFASPRIEYNFAQDFFADLGAFVNVGRSVRYSVSPLTGISLPSARSEFGAYSDLYYFSARYYF